jgi:hypothetical protein
LAASSGFWLAFGWGDEMTIDELGEMRDRAEAAITRAAEGKK